MRDFDFTVLELNAIEVEPVRFNVAVSELGATLFLLYLFRFVVLIELSDVPSSPVDVARAGAGGTEIEGGVKEPSSHSQ